MNLFIIILIAVISIVFAVVMLGLINEYIPKDKYKLFEIEFETAEEYEHEINELYRNGWIVDETIKKEEFGTSDIKYHTVRIKKR